MGKRGTPKTSRNTQARQKKTEIAGPPGGPAIGTGEVKLGKNLKGESNKGVKNEQRGKKRETWKRSNVEYIVKKGTFVARKTVGGVGFFPLERKYRQKEFT